MKYEISIYERSTYKLGDRFRADPDRPHPRIIYLLLL